MTFSQSSTRTDRSAMGILMYIFGCDLLLRRAICGGDLEFGGGEADLRSRPAPGVPGVPEPAPEDFEVSERPGEFSDKALLSSSLSFLLGLPTRLTPIFFFPTRFAEALDPLPALALAFALAALALACSTKDFFNSKFSSVYGLMRSKPTHSSQLAFQPW